MSKNETSAWVNVAAVNYLDGIHCKNGTRKLVLHQVARCSHPETLECFPSQALIAQRCGISARQVKRHLAGLEEEGRIRRSARHLPNGGRTTDLYEIVGLREALFPQGANVEKKPSTPTKPPQKDKLKEFYDSDEWKHSRARYQALKKADGRCQCCGASRKDGVRLVVDHIKPVRKHWEQRLDPNNMQVLCDECNRGKASWDETDWRDSAAASCETTN